MACASVPSDAGSAETRIFYIPPAHDKRGGPVRPFFIPRASLKKLIVASIATLVCIFTA
jgi:hypothetical protein